ncbi:glycoside hydrolase family 3 N-terminal domain-containing protein [Nocardioides sp. BP30]|uniref:glycoside hydrolase family 3 N-terminal domain-containing protein n=1 Tax=Nocardioides sp. BP30 TaxID=3036374 RepID=UPI00246835FA|nr:glycoside hydrolase family 3 N-terminal domain-containing protein [Nocardioides sp. BP30]WGL52349.1 glycoside hydrolase family 3 N-terminal domain-containing protein [Nocardioides sp. BP30]
MRQPHPRGIARCISVLAAGCLAFSGVSIAQAATTNPAPTALEKADAALSQQAATEGMVLLENHDHALPMAKSGNVALFGVGSYVTVKGGTGSGAVNNRSNVTVRQGLEAAGYTITTSPTYWNAMTSAFDTKYPPSSSGGVLAAAPDYSSVEQPLTGSSRKPTAPTDTAIFVVARNSGEGADRSSGKGDYQLTDIEHDDIELLGQTYKHVIVVLNSGGIVDTSFFKDINAEEKDPSGGTALDSLFLMSQAGEQGGAALVQVLDGEVSPSGKLTDTWASKYSYYPASATFANNDGAGNDENYSEGVYVGYRYFDSFYKKIGADNGVDPASVVDYPFGYGLSYTDFTIDPLSVTADMGSVKVKARVTNVGDTYSGKEVVETYVSAPGADKPYQQLTGYAKTDDLAPGASQQVTITFATSSMASFDEDASRWQLDKGEYVVRVGDSSRNTQVAARIELGADTPTELVNHETTDQAPASVLSSDRANFYSYPAEAEQLAAAPQVTLDTAGYQPQDDRSAYEQSVDLDATSPYYTYDGDKLSTTTAYVDGSQTNWEGTGAPYAAKTGETVQPVTTDPTSTLYDVASGKTTMQQFVAGLNVTQMANIVEGASIAGTTPSAVGAAGYTTAKYESLGIPGMALSDGPAGLRLTQQIATNPKTYQYETAWPIGTMLAQTFNRDLVKQVGEAIGKEMIDAGVTLWLAPGMNLHRDPLNGRNFEYYSEDPVVAGLTAAATTLGVQSNPGVGVTIKHFAFNNQETRRQGGNSVVDERAARELELRAFQIAVTTAQPMAVMSSYNRINGTYAAQDYDTLTDILRGEWGFKGLVMSDWGGSHDATATMYAGNDLIEPGGAPQNIINAIEKQAPVIDVAGLPVYTKTVSPTRTTYAWQFGGLTPSATGTQTITTTIDGTTDLSKQPASGTATVDVINNQTFVADPKLGSVNDAYNYVTALANSSALTAAQKAAITITPLTYNIAGDPTSGVTSYSVTIKGNYTATSYPMRLGDLQRSVSRILNVVMQSAPFQQLATNQGVKGVSVKSYDAQFDLPSILSSSLGSVVSAPTANPPTVALSTTPTAPAGGWFTGPVKVTAQVGDADTDVAYVGVDGGPLAPYTDPITVSGDGTHTVRAIVSDSAGGYGDASVEVRIDSAAPTVAASGSGGRLALTASDEVSGVASVQYSTDGGATWSAYTAPVAVKGLAQTFSYRATDKAGNTSAVGSIAVRAALHLGTPVIKGKAKVGKKLKAVVTATPGASLSYQWMRNGHAIKHATGASYHVVGADRHKKVSVEVTASAAGQSLTATSKKVRIK